MRGSVLFPFVGDSVGGSHISALTLIDALPACGVAPVVGLHQTDGPLAEHLTQRGTPYVPLSGQHVVTGSGLIREPLRMLGVSHTLARVLRDAEHVVVHTNDARMHLTWSLAARRAGVAHIWHQRTVNPSRRLGIYARMPARILTISDYCRAGLPAGMRRRAVVVDEPVDLPPVDAAAKASHQRTLKDMLAIPYKAPIIGFVGNMESQKRPALFLDMASRLADTACHFVMVGDPRSFLTDARRRELATGPLAGRVHLTGARFPIFPFIAGFDVLVAPGVREGLGRTVVEAMMLSTPVVAANDGGHAGIVESDRTGVLVPVDDAEGLASAVQALLAVPGCRTALAAAAHADARVRFAAVRHAETVTGIYTDLATDIRH